MTNDITDFPLFTDPTMIDLKDAFADALGRPIDDDALHALLLPSAIVPSAMFLVPSEVPASQLPDYDPTSADLLAVQCWEDEDIDARIARANYASALEACGRALLTLRAQVAARLAATELEHRGAA